MVPRRCPQGTLSGISPAFAGLFLTGGQVAHVLLTRSPLYSSPCGDFLARLACVRHAASVRSEPGSNSPSILGPSCEGISNHLVHLDGRYTFVRVSTDKPVAMIFDCQRTEMAGQKSSRHYNVEHLGRTCQRLSPATQVRQDLDFYQQALRLSSAFCAHGQKKIA